MNGSHYIYGLLPCWVCIFVVGLGFDNTAHPEELNEKLKRAEFCTHIHAIFSLTLLLPFD